MQRNDVECFAVQNTVMSTVNDSSANQVIQKSETLKHISTTKARSPVARDFCFRSASALLKALAFSRSWFLPYVQQGNDRHHWLEPFLSTSLLMFCIRSLHFCMPCWISTCPATRTRSSQPWCKERHCFAFPFFLGASGFQTCLVAFSEIQLPYAVPSFYFLREVVLHLTNRIAAWSVFLIATVATAWSNWLQLK